MTSVKEEWLVGHFLGGGQILSVFKSQNWALWIGLWLNPFGEVVGLSGTVNLRERQEGLSLCGIIEWWKKLMH